MVGQRRLVVGRDEPQVVAVVLASPNLKLPYAGSCSTGTRPAGAAMLAPLGEVSMVICLRNDQSVCHHAAAGVGASTGNSNHHQLGRMTRSQAGQLQ